MPIERPLALVFKNRDKKWVIDQLKTTALSVDKLTEIVGSTLGIVSSDAGGLRLLAKQSELDDLCNKFWNVTGAAKAKQAFDDYVSVVQTRNAHIMVLNESLARLRDFVAGKAQTTSATAKASLLAANQADAGSGTLVAQLTRMTSRARADCIEALYLAGEAYAFWALKPANALAAVLSDLRAGRPLAMSATALTAAGEQMLLQYEKTIDTMLGQRPIWFPPKQATNRRGLFVELTPESHPRVFKGLRTNGETWFHLSAPRYATPAESSPFAGHADVRLSEVRCWISGVVWTPSHGPKIRVDLEHEGHEHIVGPDNVLATFRHTPVHLTMTYDSTRPCDLDGISEQSSLTDVGRRDGGALIGPFARWRLKVITTLNPGVILEKVDKITLEMCGTARSFN